MDESRIKKQLEVQEEYIELAKESAAKRNFTNTARYMAQAKMCKDAVYGLLMGLEAGISRITPEIMKNAEENRNHPLAIKCREQYDNGLEYCKRQLGGKF